MAEALRMLEDMSVESYLRKVEQGYGGSVLEDLLLELQGVLTFTKKLVLKEHHLYGSSRLGVKTHKRVLLHKEFSISGFSESGEVVEDEIIDSLVYVTNENYFCRVLGQKQYELANHLGNVLATVLDRRTAVYHPQADTFLYFMADVVNASMYYPFGQALMNYKNEDFVFSYGLNGQEKEDEVFEGVYSAEYWMYDSRLGRRWNVDPIVKVHESPYATFANNPMWFVDPNGDDTSTINSNSGGYVGFNIVENPKQGDKFTINSGLFLNYDNITGRVSTGYKYSETKVFHAGNDYANAGWYTEADYEYNNRDWAGGQVLESLSGLDALFGGSREWNGWEVGNDGYLTGKPVIQNIGGAGAIEYISGVGVLGKASKALKAAQAAKHLNKAGNYSVYNYIKNGALYIGKAKNGEAARYGLKFVDINKVKAFDGLAKTIPNNGVALGIEQTIMNLNGFGTPGKLSNIRAATQNEILIKEGIKHLNTHCPGWEKLFKLQ